MATSTKNHSSKGGKVARRECLDWFAEKRFSDQERTLAPGPCCCRPEESIDGGCPRRPIALRQHSMIHRDQSGSTRNRWPLRFALLRQGNDHDSDKRTFREALPSSCSRFCPSSPHPVAVRMRLPASPQKAVARPGRARARRAPPLEREERGTGTGGSGTARNGRGNRRLGHGGNSARARGNSGSGTAGTGAGTGGSGTGGGNGRFGYGGDRREERVVQARAGARARVRRFTSSCSWASRTWPALLRRRRATTTRTIG